MPGLLAPQQKPNMLTDPAAYWQMLSQLPPGERDRAIAEILNGQIQQQQPIVGPPPPETMVQPGNPMSSTWDHFVNQVYGTMRDKGGYGDFSRSMKRKSK